MRKQTKLVAVLSAAALLAIGASMTSFAAGWQKDDAGVWHYYDKDDEMVAGEWAKDGGKWFYLDDDGDMLVDSWVDDDYYVGDDGAMLINQWKKTAADDDFDDPDDGGDHWYYFGNKGKKVVDQSKKINGKTYFFNTDGEMRDGWYQDTDGNIYYLGDEDDGARASGWLWLDLPDEEEDDDEKGWHSDCDVSCDDEGWYYFGNDGKMYKDAGKKKKINGKYYYFNKHGQMLYEWINTKSDEGNVLDGADNVATLTDATPSIMEYANQVEEGWRADGWYEIDGSENTNTQNDTDWYYFKDGKAKKADLSGKDKVVDVTDDGDQVYRMRYKVSGKYFCFNEYGQMQTGLQVLYNGNGSYSFYYFDDNGYMKTGKVSDVEEDDDESYNYYFNTKNGGNGKGWTGEKDGYLYWNGKRLEADDDYRLYNLGNGDIYLVNSKGKIQKSASKKYDVENTNEEDVQFTFSKSKVTGVKSGSDMNLADEAYYPVITLFDVKFTNDPTVTAEADGEDVVFAR